MATNASGSKKPTALSNRYTEHVEPPRVGGARYLRCTECGREVIGTDPSRLLHAEDCPYREADR